MKNCSLCGKRSFSGKKWYSENEILLCLKCWPNLDPTVEWFERRYDGLNNSIGDILNQKIKLFKLLGFNQLHVKIEDGEWLTEQIIEKLGLPKGNIQFEFKELDNKIAGTVECTGQDYLVHMSQDLQDNYRALSAILIHELMHIYLNNHGLLYHSYDEYEELTDLSCIMLGFGVPMINAKRAWAVDRTVLGGGFVGKGTSYYNIGYLSENQIGYAFAYFMFNNDLQRKDVESEIDDQCWHIFESGKDLYQRYYNAVINRRKANIFLTGQGKQKEMLQFSCPICFLKMAVPKKTIERVGIFIVKCHRCGSEIHYDGNKVVKFRESLK